MMRPRLHFRRQRRDRAGAAMVEMALIGPLAFLLLIGLIVLSLGVFRHNQVASLAQEAARWASVRGKNYQSVQHRSVLTAADVYAGAIKPRAVAMDLERLAYQVTWDEDRSAVTVSLQYRWLPEAYFGETTISSQCTVLVSN